MDTKQTPCRWPRWSTWRSKADRPSREWQARHPEAVLVAIKTIHTLAWFSIESCMVYLLYAGFAKRSDRSVVVATVVVGGETLIFAANGFHCPLTRLAEIFWGRQWLGHRYLPPKVVRTLSAGDPCPAHRAGGIPPWKKPTSAEEARLDEGS